MVEDDFLLSYNDAPEWGKGLISFMKSSVKSIKISTRSVSSELKRLKIAKKQMKKEWTIRRMRCRMLVIKLRSG